MQKFITLRFQGVCKRCNQTIPAGSRAVWLGKGSGIQHQTCTPQKVEVETPKATPRGVDRMTFDYATLRSKFADFLSEPTSVLTRNPQAIENLKYNWGKEGGSWAGCSTVEMTDFLNRGYHVQGLEGISSLVPGKPRRKIRYADEGDELLIDLAWSGSDEPFMEWEKRVSKPGLSVEIHTVFSHNVPAATIVQYQRWIARALQTLDESGVDMEVNLVVAVQGTSSSDPYLNTETLVRVRKPGEASDFSSWSAMFSPGGFRMLGILAVGMHVDALGKTIRSGFGQTNDYGAWTVAYDAERNVIVIGNSDTNFTFPEFEMTEKLQSVLAILNG
jgi:hypothetical protein